MAVEPGELYELHLEVPQLDELREPVLVHALDGYVDAGSGVRLAVDHLLNALDHTVVATFDADALIDYRSRRPTFTFTRNRFTGYSEPKLVVHLVHDSAGQPFLLMTGPEPDVYWERFVSAVGQLVDRFAVRLTVGMLAIPMGVPHTRPTGMSHHSTRAGLLPDQPDWVGTVEVPGTRRRCWSTGSGRRAATASDSPPTCRTIWLAPSTRRRPANCSRRLPTPPDWCCRPLRWTSRRPRCGPS